MSSGEEAEYGVRWAPNLKSKHWQGGKEGSLCTSRVREQPAATTVSVAGSPGRRGNPRGDIMAQGRNRAAATSSRFGNNSEAQNKSARKFRDFLETSSHISIQKFTYIHAE